MAIIESIMNEIMKNEIVAESTLYSSNDALISVDKNKGRNGYGSSYFKYYIKRHGKWFVARILLCKPEFTPVEHSNSADTSKGKFGNVKNATTLSSKESRELMRIITSMCTDQNYIYLGATTIYSAMIIESNMQAGVSRADIIKYKDEDLENCPRPILPSNCPIPDYTTL